MWPSDAFHLDIFQAPSRSPSNTPMKTWKNSTSSLRYLHIQFRQLVSGWSSLHNPTTLWLHLARFSAYRRIQDGADCGNEDQGLFIGSLHFFTLYPFIVTLCLQLWNMILSLLFAITKYNLYYLLSQLTIINTIFQLYSQYSLLYNNSWISINNLIKA